LKTISTWEDLWGQTPHKKQEIFLRTPKKLSLYIGGFGAGKSWANAARVILATLESAAYAKSQGMTGASDGIVVCPTYQLCLDVMGRAILQLNDQMVSKNGHGIVRSFNKSRMEIVTTYGSKILLRSATRCQNLVGLNLGFAGMDEATVMAREEETFDLLQARLRCPKTHPSRRALWVTSTPKSYTGCIRKLGELKKVSPDEVCIVRASSMDNPHLDPSFVESLKSSYSKARWRAEVLGEVLAPTSAIFPEFSQKHIIPWVRGEGDWIAGADWGLTRHHFLEIDVVKPSPDAQKIYVVCGEHFTPNESIDRQNKWWHELKSSRYRAPLAVGIDRADNWKQGKMLRAWGWRTKQNDDSTGAAQRILPGIEVIRDLLDPADGWRPRLYLSEELVREGRQNKESIFYSFQNYQWLTAANGSPIDVPQKGGAHGADHAIDCLRYAIMSQERYRTTSGYFTADNKPRIDNALRIV